MTEKMAKEKIEYDELSRCRISNAKSVVISKCSKGGFTIAQQVDVPDDGALSTVFLKGAIHVKGRSEMLAIADAIAKSVEIYDAEHETDEEDGIDWDDE